MSQSATVPLHARHFGEPGRTPVVLLHGLLGASRNWQTVARELGDVFSVYAVDLRNHGESPHAEEMDYPVLAADVAAFLAKENLPPAHLLGHSMGGKTAMLVASRWPERVASLTVVDIAPKEYASHHREEFAAMNALDLARIGSRPEADAALAALGVKDWAMRQFLLTNLTRDAAGDFRWLINLPMLTAALPELVKNPLPEESAGYAGPTFFVRGGKSDFVTDADAAVIRRYFPAAEIVVLPESGHNPHIEVREQLVTLLRKKWAD